MQRLTRRTWLGLAAGAAWGRNASAAESLTRAAAFLWRHQARDGGWHSETYGLLRSGQSLTGFVLEVLLRAPGEAPSGGVDRALAFLERHIGDDGSVGRVDPIVEDYPNYATSLALSCFLRAGRTQAVPRLVAYLRGQQFTEELGWKSDDAAYGGWGMGGEPHRAPHSGHVDLSMTRHVLEALRRAGVEPVKARRFVHRCQNPDGGFFFSPVVTDANKAGSEGEQFRSYGSMTADGILALLACGSFEETRPALRFLLRIHRPEEAPGFSGAYARFAKGLRFYYAAAASEAFRRLGVRDYAMFTPSLVADQRQDGSWANPEQLVKEDDPLIATGFALRALLNEMG